MARWSPDGRHLYVQPLLQGTEAGQTAAMPVAPGASPAPLPEGGVQMAADAVAIWGTKVLDFSAYDPAHAGAVAPGIAPDTFTFTKTVSHRNLFQVRLPQ